MVPAHPSRDRVSPARWDARADGRAVRRLAQRRQSGAGRLVRRRDPRRPRAPEPAPPRPQLVLRRRHLVAGRCAREPRREVARLPRQRRRQRLDDDPAARARQRTRDRRRGREGEVQRGHLAAGRRVVPLPPLRDRRLRGRHRVRGAAGWPAPAAPGGRAAGRGRARARVPGRPASRHHPGAVARRQVAGRTPARGDVGEEPAVVPARGHRGGRQLDRRAAEGRRRDLRRVLPDPHGRPHRLPAHRPRGADAPSGARRPRGVRRHRLPRARGRGPGVRAPAGAGRGGRRRAGRGAPRRRAAAADPVDPRRRLRAGRRARAARCSRCTARSATTRCSWACPR